MTRLHRILGLIAVVLIIGCAGRLTATPQPAAQPHEYRAFWVDTFNTALNTPADVASVVADAVQANANALFVQVRRRGDAWYVDSSEPLPQDVPIARDFDPLAELIARGHAARLEIHAFVIVGALWNLATAPRDPRHVFARHGVNPQTGRMYEGRDNWITRTLIADGASSSVGGYRIGSDFWIEPGHPDATAYTVDVLTRLVARYDIDGLHLDRIRYPEISISGQTPATGVSIGYNETNVGRFLRINRRTPTETPAPSDPLWSEWRRRQVTSLVRRIYLNTIAVKPMVKVSAALITFGGGPASEAAWTQSEAYWRVFQDWRAWTEEGILDLAVPMNYKTEHTATGRTMFDQWLVWTRTHRYNRQALIGIGAYLNGVEGTIRQVRRSLAPSVLGGPGVPAGPPPEGVVFFSHANTNVAIANNPFATPAGQDTPRRSYADFASGLLTGRSSDGRVSFDAASPVFAAPAAVPDMPWKTNPRTGHVMGFALRALEAPIDSARVEIRRASSVVPGTEGRVSVDTSTDGGGFYGAVDLAPGVYLVRVTPLDGGAIRAECRVDVVAGAVRRLNIVLEPTLLKRSTCQ